jgi:hypothetical protein
VSKREFKRKISTFQCCWPNKKTEREEEFLQRETENEEERMLCVNQRGKHLLLQ